MKRIQKTRRYDRFRFSLNMEHPRNKFIGEISSVFDLSPDATSIYMGLLLSQRELFCSMKDLAEACYPRPSMPGFDKGISELIAKGLVASRDGGFDIVTQEGPNGERVVRHPDAAPAGVV